MFEMVSARLYFKSCNAKKKPVVLYSDSSHYTIPHTANMLDFSLMNEVLSTEQNNRSSSAVPTNENKHVKINKFKEYAKRVAEL